MEEAHWLLPGFCLLLSNLILQTPPHILFATSSIVSTDHNLKRVNLLCGPGQQALAFCLQFLGGAGREGLEGLDDEPDYGGGARYIPEAACTTPAGEGRQGKGSSGGGRRGRVGGDGALAGAGGARE